MRVLAAPGALRRPDARRGLPPGALLAALLGALTAPVTVAAPEGAGDQALGETELVGPDAIWRYARGRREPTPERAPDGTLVPGLRWTRAGFDDSEWNTGLAPFGYGDGDDATHLDDMESRYLAVYIRRAFRLNEASLTRVERLLLRVRSDDGFVAYLNGTEVARARLDGDPPGVSRPASALHEADRDELFPLDPGLLVPGANVLALHGANHELSSTDFTLGAVLVANPDLCPDPEYLSCSFDLRDDVVQLSWRNLYAYDRIEIHRSGRHLATIFGRAESWTDRVPPLGFEVAYDVVAVLDDEPCPALSCEVPTLRKEDRLVREGDVWRYFRGHGNPPAGWIAPGFDDSGWEEGATGIGYGDGDDRTVLDDMQRIEVKGGGQDGYLAVFCRKTFNVEDEVPEALQLSVIYDDGIVVWLNEEEIGRINVDTEGAVGWLTPALSAVKEPARAELVLPSKHLRPGENLLAVSVHNVTETSSDLSFIPVVHRVPTRRPGPSFLRGDATDDGRFDITDAIFTLDFLFRGGDPPSCLDAADTDDDGTPSLTDPVLTLNHLFRGTPPPPPPGPAVCGPDPTPDPLVACVATSCSP